MSLPNFARGLLNRHRYKVLYGGRGGGRSWSVARALLVIALKHRVRILCTREFQSSIKDSVHHLLKSQIEMMRFDSYFEVLEREIRTINGSIFLFEGLRRNVTKIKSLEAVDICWIEEAERVTENSWQVLIPTIRKEGSEIWVTFNPDLESDPTYRRFVLNPPPDTLIVKTNWRHNPWLTTELRDEKDYLMRVDPDAALHVWEGFTRQASDAQILKNKWFVEEFTPEATWDGPYHGADFGFSKDPTTLVRSWIHDRTLYLEREAYKIALEINHYVDHWTNAMRDLDSHVSDLAAYVIRCDSGEPGTISYLVHHGLPKAEGAEKWAGSVEDGIRHLRGYERIIIHPRCKNAISEARLYSFKTDPHTGDVLPDIIDRHNHIIDAMRYALAPFIKRLKRRKAAFGSG